MLFSFKEFSVNQDKCAMKVGTDGVLLGAWAPIAPHTNSVLDIGAGTGLIALMIAQRSTIETIDALEIDSDAYEQAAENFENSPWADRLFCYHAGLNEFAEEIEEQYDLIISNPPFYTENYKTQDPKRDLARFTDALPFEHLIHGAAKLLSPKGTAAFIIPHTEENQFITLAEKADLFPTQITRVKGTPKSPIKRSLIAFSFNKENTVTNELVIEISRHQYTPEYKALTKDFYLKM